MIDSPFLPTLIEAIERGAPDESAETNGASLMPTPAEDLRRERDRVKAAERGQTPSEIFWAGGNSVSGTSGDTSIAVPLNNGPRPQGAPAFRVAGGLAQTDGLSRVRQRQPIALQNDKYPFKTLFYAITPGTSQYKIFRGGDISPQIFSDFGSVQLVNSGGKSGWSGSAAVSPQPLKFFRPGGEFLALNLGAGSGDPSPKGANFWAYSPAIPLVSISRRLLSGSVPQLADNSSSINLESGTATSYNFSIADAFTATLTGLNWPPYNAGPFAMGDQVWTTTTAYDGVVGNRPNSDFSWRTVVRQESRAGELTAPLRLFFYTPEAQNPVPGVLGEMQFFHTGSVTGSSTRAQDFSTYTSTLNITDKNGQKKLISLPLFGQSLDWAEESSTKVTSTTKDDRSVAGGTTATRTFNETRKTISNSQNPLNKLLVGKDVALCLVEQFGSTITSATTESHQITSSIRTIVDRPSMQSPIVVFSNDYIFSGGLTGSGPLGGWYSASNASITSQGEPAPQANLHQLGNPFPSGFNEVQASQHSGSFLYSLYDSPGAYGDNFTTAQTYSEYTTVQAKSIRNNIYNDFIFWAPEWNCESNYSRVVDTTFANIYPTEYKLVSSAGIITIPPEQSISIRGISPSLVTAPTGAGTLSISSPTPISNTKTIRTSWLREQRRVTTEVRHNSLSPTVSNPVREDNTWTSEDLSIIGKRAEVYRKLNGTITKWSGTIQSYDGDRTPPIPAAFRQVDSTHTESNTFIGPYPQTIAIKSLAIAVDAVEQVGFCLWGLTNDNYMIVLNSDFAFEAFVDPLFSSIVVGKDGVPTIYAVSGDQYRSGEVNYAAVWKFRNGRFVKENDVKGKTKGNGAVTVGSLLAVQYSPN